MTIVKHGGCGARACKEWNASSRPAKIDNLRKSVYDIRKEGAAAAEKQKAGIVGRICRHQEGAYVHKAQPRAVS